ncbi:TonB-dependent receptor plug domain-containing protein [Bermanella sp. WJH001]|uniref:TonB-dependent receptor plug domain-containing protein n=1 Tax=Bermanella sp. WJH001 TaxID=3048005 RepID=UPI0024BDDED2|nr:TonB-dependent receptor plug domain-containing protein [Bermanella sp. WJH001]MDJ1539662.1 TonB-dependent receptor plug domain-containing protein [Bermanella sp. WJH001]
MKRFSFIICTIACQLLVPNVFAEGSLDTVTVHANQPTGPTSVFRQTILRDEFIHQYQDLGDVLQHAAGLQVRTSSPGNPASISIRGSTHKQISFIIDGKVINNAQTGDFDINQIPLSQIESIEVIQGSNSDSQGYHSIGGTIKITTIDASANNNSAQFNLGSFDTQKFNINLGGQYLGFWKLNFEHYETRSDFDYPVPSPLDNPNDSNRIESIRNNAYERNAAIVKWKYSLPSITFINKLQASSDQKNLPDYQMNSPENQSSISNENTAYSLQIDWNINKNLKSFTILDFSYNNESYEDLTSHISFKPTHLEFETKSYNVMQNYELSWGHSILNFSVNAFTESFDEDDLLTSNTIKCTESLSICDIQSNQDQFTYKAGYKFYTSKFNIFSDIGITQLSRQQEEKYGDQDSSTTESDYTTWSVQLQALNWHQGLISFNTNKGIRIPSLFELFGNRGLVKSNSNLSPEESINISLDVEFNSIEFNKSRIIPSSSIYYRQLDNAIVPIYSGSVGTFENANSAKILGWQNRINYQATHYNLGISAVLQESQTESSYSAFDNKKLAGIYHKQLVIHSSFKFLEYGNIYFSHDISSDLFLDKANNHKLSENQRSSVKISWRQSNYTGSIHINNLFNNEYFDQYNRPIQDRSISLNNYFEF